MIKYTNNAVEMARLADVEELAIDDRQQELISAQCIAAETEALRRRFTLRQIATRGIGRLLAEAACEGRPVQPVYAFSRRESVDQPQPDGSVRKVAVFRHLGFVETT